jgi:hypothetical protein
MVLLFTLNHNGDILMKRIILITIAFLTLSACSVSDGITENFEPAPLPTITTSGAAPAGVSRESITEAVDVAASADEQADAPAETKAETTTAAKTTTAPTETTTKKDTEALYIKELFDEKKTDVWVSGKGNVTRILSDDNEGDRHQRFILEMSTGQTLLIAHNIDIAPYLEGLEKGDIVSFYGEYYWSDEGGGIHWTHHDPDGSSDGGWLKCDGETYK